jgi:hypothetical protein
LARGRSGQSLEWGRNGGAEAPHEYEVATFVGDRGRMMMFDRGLIGACALLAALLTTIGGAMAFDESVYPNLKGQWRRAPNSDGGNGLAGRFGTFDPSRGWGPAQQAPLTPEYQARFEANLKDQEAGGQGIGETYTCVSPGMPRVINGYGQTEFVVTPRETHILVENIHDSRRIFTDGRPWPASIELSLNGYSIGKWIDADGHGKYDVLEVETRGFRGPRAYDASGIPLHDDNQTVVNERIYLDKNDPNLLHDDVTVMDHALTRPWSVQKGYRRSPDRQPLWVESVCAESNSHVQIGDEGYMMSGDGYLMPTKRGQAPPDLKYFPNVNKK